MQTWEIWYPDAAATGLLVARGRLDPTSVLWLHAAPPALAVTLSDESAKPVARAAGLDCHGERLPMTRLSLVDDSVQREDRWPNDGDLGALVILRGGKVGSLTAWWNAPDGREWRWQIELSNRLEGQE